MDNKTPQYFYRVSLGVVTLNKGDDSPIKKIGKYKTDAEAIEACKKHHEKACNMARAANRPSPTIYFL